MTKDAVRTPEGEAQEQGAPDATGRPGHGTAPGDTGRTEAPGRTEAAGTPPATRGPDARGPDAHASPSSPSSRTDESPAPGDAGADTTARVWRGLAALVLEQHQGRKEVVEALGMSFFRIKALRRIAARPSSMSDLAARLGTDRPYLSLVVDDLVKRGLAERHQHPTDRRCKIVELTPEGRAAADRADAIMSTPPPQLAALPPEDLAALDRILGSMTSQV